MELPKVKLIERKLIELSARTEPCGCWGDHGCRRIIVECEAGTLIDVCEFAALLLGQINPPWMRRSPWVDFWPVLQAFGIEPTTSIPEAWSKAVWAAED